MSPTPDFRPPPPRDTEPPRRDTARFEAPESESWQKLLVHIIDEMPWRVVGAIAFIVFFFVYGAGNSLIKLTGRDITSLDFPIGPLLGSIAASALTAWIIATKRRHRR